MWWKSVVVLSVRRWCSRQYYGQRTLEEGTTMVAHALNGVGLSHRGTVGGGVHRVVLSRESLLRRHFDAVGWWWSKRWNRIWLKSVSGDEQGLISHCN